MREEFDCLILYSFLISAQPTHIFFTFISSSLVNTRLHTENLALYLAWKCLKSSCGWWWLDSKLSDQLWLSFSLALAKPNNYALCNKSNSLQILADSSNEIGPSGVRALPRLPA